MNNTAVPLVASKYFKQETVTLQPKQKLEIGGFKMYYIMYTFVDPPTGLGFIQVSIDNGPFFPISLLPYRDEAGFQYITLYNNSTYTFTVSLIIAVSREASLLGTWTPSYVDINAERYVSASVSGTSSQYLGPYYIGIRPVVFVSLTSISLTSSSNLFAAGITIYVVNSDQLGNKYSYTILGSVLQGSIFYPTQSISFAIDGTLLTPYIMLYVQANPFTSQYVFNLTITAR
jgi:hypothetical protein